MEIRRVVTGNDAAGKSTFVSVGAAPRAHWYQHVPGSGVAVIWSTAPGATVPNAGADRTQEIGPISPPPGGSTFVILQLPPDSVMTREGFDAAAAGQENLDLIPGVAERMDPEDGGMHATDTIDYVVVLEGEVWAVLDDGREQLLRQHDVLVQNGTRHRWSNRSDKPVRLAGIMIGAARTA